MKDNYVTVGAVSVVFFPEASRGTPEPVTYFWMALEFVCVALFCLYELMLVNW